MLDIEFDSTDALPTTPVVDRGPMSAAFAAREIPDLRAAANWLADLPYGYNEVSDAVAVFRDGHGTCVTKHGALIHLADELGVDVELQWGYYALDESIVAGAGEVLERFRVPFVPNVHCFLDSAGSFVDLTRGNCTGKRLDIETYLEVVAARFDDDDVEACHRFAERLHQNDPRFAATTPETIMAARAECLAKLAASCALDS